MSRRKIIAEIEGLVAPHFHDSGYRKVLDPAKGIFGGTRPLRLWTPQTPMELDGFVLRDVLAITEDGVMEDATGGGCVTPGWGCYPVEDLRMLRKALQRALSSEAPPISPSEASASAPATDEPELLTPTEGEA